MSYLTSIIFSSKSPVGFILLALFVVNASCVHVGIEKMPLAHVPGAERAKALYSNQLEKRDGSIITVRLEDYYITTIYTDDGSAEYDVIVDTGSPLTWVGAGPKNPYIQGHSGWPTGQELRIVYAAGEFEGRGYIDSIILETRAGSEPLTINSQFMGSATLVTNFPALIDGILGLGRNVESWMRGPDGNLISTIFESLYTQGAIKYAAFGIYFIPLNDKGVGEITFGYCNEAVITSALSYAPITSVPPASSMWGIYGAFMYDGRTILNPTSGIIDTGAPTISIPKDATLAYMSATGAIQGSDGWLTIGLEQYDSLQILSIIIGGQSYDFSPNAQIKPRATLASPIKLVINVIPDNYGLGFVLGHPFMQRYYVFFNATSSQIGFASTHNTASTTN
ncbi:hypothetical protein ID866_5016 [Astraeus odoratus]|nr:hypothetical protein ID866_5016 [Astraeus odoratus]